MKKTESQFKADVGKMLVDMVGEENVITDAPINFLKDWDKGEFMGETKDGAVKTAGYGHNRVGGVAVDQLKSIIARVEKLEEEKAGISADIRDVFSEAKGNGFDVRAIRQIIKLRKLDASEREEQETILDVYMNALGMLPDQEGE